MVKSQVTSVTPAQHAVNHIHGGSDPITGDVRIDYVPNFVDAEEVLVFDGTSPAAWTDLDLSAVVGAKRAMVCLSLEAAGGNYVGFRTNGSSITYFTGAAPTGTQGGAYGAAGRAMAVIVMTDAAGIVEWITENAEACTIDMLWYSLL